MQAQLKVLQSNQQLMLQNAEHDRKMVYAVLVAVTGLCGYVFITNGRLRPGSIIFKFNLTCFTDFAEDEVVALLNNHFRPGIEVYYKDFEARVGLINDTIIGR